jgi:hypothetical protein
MVGYFINYLIEKFSIFTEKLAAHPEIGLYCTLQVITLNYIPIAEGYDSSFMHLTALVLKDLGIIAGSILSILTLYVYISRNLLKDKKIRQNPNQ